MIAINLLSPQEKNRLKNEKLFTSAKEVILLILLFSAVAGIILIFANHILRGKLDKISLENAEQVELNKGLDNQISDINKKITEMAGVQRDFKSWSQFIFEVSHLASNGILYQSLVINYQDSSLEINGQAKTRDDLLKFKEILSQSPLFTEINLPLSDLMAKENNHFKVITAINLNKLR